MKEKSFWIKYGRTIILVVLVCVCANVFEEMVDDVFYDPVVENSMEAILLDQSVHESLAPFRSKSTNQVMTDITALGSISVLSLLLVIMLVILLRYKDHIGVLYLSANAIGCAILITTLKNFFGRDRPDEATRLIEIAGLSFPSGHSFASASLYFAFAYYFGRKTGYATTEILFYVFSGLIIFLVGFSRVYLGVHYLTDVIAGISAGLIWSGVLAVVMEVITIRRNHYQQNAITKDVLANSY